MSTAEFNETIHAPLRLRICASLASVDTLEFGALRDELQVADSVLSKHLKVLADEGFVALDKPTGRGGRPKTWARITKAGQKALAGHIAALRELAEMADLGGTLPAPAPAERT
ncbi:MAG TPA: helix-turn-helix domain-containing protein [Actinomycetales bacterium]|nr:helix-turn-helix domain-containing protein [Actinomycetales bacterium]